MNKEKYYTPKIEEFHVGFEYQYKNKNKWLKTIFQDGRSVEYHEEQRVKYLDKEDIRDLGWLLMKEDKEIDYYSFKKDKNELIINFLDSYFGITVTIFYYINNNTRYSFSTPIKNKSELKKLMKQLNII